jgi:hypothetical protein
LLKKIVSGISWFISKVKAAYAWAVSEETQAKAMAICTKIRETIMTISRKAVDLINRVYLVKELTLEAAHGGKEGFKKAYSEAKAAVKAMSAEQVAYVAV